MCVCSNRTKTKQRSTRFPELTDEFDVKTPEAQILEESENCKALTEDEHKASNSSQSEDSAPPPPDITSSSVVECSADSQHKLDADEVIDEKPPQPQFSPRALSQSDSGKLCNMFNSHFKATFS